MSKKSTLTFGDLRGIADLITEATIEITDLTQDLHHRIVHPPFLPSTPIQHLITGISGLVYNNVRGVTRLVGKGLTKSLAQINPHQSTGLALSQKDKIVAVLNGVIGDHLAAKESPLEIQMHLCHEGEKVVLKEETLKRKLSTVNGDLLLLVHGLCMDENDWDREGCHYGEQLAAELHLTPVYLRYNSGLHISENGEKLSSLLENLTTRWPVPLQNIYILGHSMGGLVSRSAVGQGNHTGKNWVKYLRKMIFLGTPHQGAPLERLGSHIDQILATIPYTKPFARLGKIRSSGITDLRYGNLLPEDWQGTDRFSKHSDRRTFLPLPENVESFAVAATLGTEGDHRLKTRTLGDGLVPVESALGQHQTPGKQLSFKPSDTHLTYQTSHQQLLSSPGVFAKIKSWLAQ